MTVRKVKNNIGGMLEDLRRLMHEGMADPSVRRLAEEAISTNPQCNEIQAIHMFVREKFAYAPDPVDSELFIHPRLMAEDYYSERPPRSGDCDDHSLLVSAMLGSIGFQSRVVIADTDKDMQWDHAYAQCYSDILDRWINVDTTSEFPLGWEFHTWREAYVE